MPVVLDADGHLALPGLAGQPTRSARALASARGRGQAVTVLPGRARRLLCAAARLAAVVACLGGLPYALARLAGWPLPRHVSSFTRLPALLAAPVSDQEILKIVACVVWLAWIIFALSVIAEVAAAARGRPTPQLPGTGPVQALAAALLGTTVLTAIMQASPLAALPATLTAHAAPAAQTQPAQSRPAASAAPARPASARHAAADHGMGSQHRTPRTRIYRVVEGDNLWDIAERYLGDGQRWHEIFALNQERPQPDGQELTDPNLIKPGWVLRLPPAPLTRPAPAGQLRSLSPPAQRTRPPGPRRRRTPPVPDREPSPSTTAPRTAGRESASRPAAWPASASPPRSPPRWCSQAFAAGAATVPATACPPASHQPGPTFRRPSPPCAAPPPHSAQPPQTRPRTQTPASPAQPRSPLIPRARQTAARPRGRPPRRQPPSQAAPATPRAGQNRPVA